MSNRKHSDHSRSMLGSRGRRTPLTALGVLGMLLIWSVLSFGGIVPSLILPSPWRVLISVQDVGLSLIAHFFSTFSRLIVGLALGSVVGIALGSTMQYSRKIFLLLDGIVETGRPIPPVALVPFFILIFGFSEYGKILLVVIGSGLVITITTIEAIERLPTQIIRWGLITGLTRQSLFRYIILPAALPEMRGGFRIALVVSLSLVIVSEFMGAKYGLGYLINVSKVTLTTPTIFLSIILLGWMSWGADRLIRIVFDRHSSWELRAKEAIR